jgi:hypothetical protein
MTVRTRESWVLRSTWSLRWTVVGSAVLTVAAHLLFLGTTPGADEGGYAVVAHYANDPGPYIYGPTFVDRPPLLIQLFRFAALLGSQGTLIVATIAALVCVLAAARAASLIAGARAARWAAAITAGFSSSPLLQAENANGEIIAAAFVATSIALILEADRIRRNRPWRAGAVAVLSGATAMGALFVKQNFGDAIAFAVVLAIAYLLTRGRVLWSLAVGYVLGAVAIVGWALLWSRHHHGVGALFYAMYGVRADAAGAVSSITSVVQLENIAILIGAGLASGVFLLAFAVLRANWRRGLRQIPIVGVAYLAAIAVEVVGILGGGNFASHYLIGLIPTLSVCTGVMIANWRHGHHVWGLRWVRLTSVAIVASSLISSPVAAVAEHADTNAVQVVGDWVHAAANPQDTIAVPFSNSPVIQISGLRPAYPYNWVLLVRTRDLRLAQFNEMLNGPHAPTWVIEWDLPSEVGLKAPAPIVFTLRKHYQLLGELCGKNIWLLDGHAPRVALTRPACD